MELSVASSHAWFRIAPFTSVSANSTIDARTFFPSQKAAAASTVPSGERSSWKRSCSAYSLARRLSPIAVLSRISAKLAPQVRHLDRRGSRVPAPVAHLAARALGRLLGRLGGEDPEGDRDPGLRGDRSEAARHVGRDQIEVRRLAADEDAERHDRVVLLCVGEAPRDRRQLERSRHADDCDGGVLRAVARQAVDRPREEAGNQRLVEPARDDRDAKPLRPEMSFDDFRHKSSFIRSLGIIEAFRTPCQSAVLERAQQERPAGGEPRLERDVEDEPGKCGRNPPRSPRRRLASREAEDEGLGENGAEGDEGDDPDERPRKPRRRDDGDRGDGRGGQRADEVRHVVQEGRPHHEGRQACRREGESREERGVAQVRGDEARGARLAAGARLDPGAHLLEVRRAVVDGRRRRPPWIHRADHGHRPAEARRPPEHREERGRASPGDEKPQHHRARGGRVEDREEPGISDPHAEEGCARRGGGEARDEDRGPHRVAARRPIDQADSPSGSFMPLHPASFWSCAWRSAIAAGAAPTSDSTPNPWTVNDASAVPAETARRIDVSSRADRPPSPRAARQPTRPPAKVSPAPVGSTTPSRISAGTNRRYPFPKTAAPCSPRFTTRAFGPIFRIAPAARARFPSPERSIASSSLMTRRSMTFSVLSRASRLPSIQKFIVSQTTRLGRSIPAWTPRWRSGSMLPRKRYGKADCEGGTRGLKSAKTPSSVESVVRPRRSSVYFAAHRKVRPALLSTPLTSIPREARTSRSSFRKSSPTAATTDTFAKWRAASAK